jgi:hypothetical protein
MGVRPTERVERAIAYLMEGGTDPAVLADMGLSTRELDDVVTLVPWGHGVAIEMRAAVEELCESRARAEAEAGLRMSVVVVRPPARRRPSVGVAALVVAALAGTIFAVVGGAGAGRQEPAPTLATPERARPPATKPSRTRPRARAAS